MRRWCLPAALVLSSPAVWAGKAHVHGVVAVQVAIDGQQLSVQLEAPLDSLLGFEHRPRTPAQREAAQAVLKTLNEPQQWLGLPAAAQCQWASTEIDADVLRPVEAAAKKADPPAKHSADHPADTHADLLATVSFRCAQADALRTLELGLFKRFPRIQRIEAQWVNAQGQGKQTLRAPNGSLRIGPR